MNIFSSTRIRLTAWYALIIILINIFFSFALYVNIDTELERLGRTPLILQDKNQVLQEVNGLDDKELRLLLDPNILYEARANLVSILIVTDIFIIILATGISYYLAGRTLEPIRAMHLKQQQFVANASMEIKTPLNILRDDIEKGLSSKNTSQAKLKNILEKNLDEINMLQGLTENLLILASIEGSTIPDIVIVNIHDAFITAINKVKPLADKKSIQIINKSHVKYIQANKDEIVRLFVILLENAIKYSNNNKKIKIDSKLGTKKIHIYIKDHGIGISQKDLPFVFDRFYKAGNKKQDGTGYGLGLSIAQSIVLRHKGKITVKSKPGAGSTFTIELPYKLQLT